MDIPFFVYLLHFATFLCGAQQYNFKILGQFYCGNQNVTGILEIVKDGVLYSSCQVSRNIVAITGDLELAPPAGKVSMTLRTPCGVISRLGTCCDHLFELNAHHTSGTFKIKPTKNITIIDKKGEESDAENLLGLIKDGRSKMVCTDTDSSACVPYCNMPWTAVSEQCVRWDITKAKCGCRECEKQCEAAKRKSCRND
ncbi:hypothetical protein DdX_12973 [Ditylenchus destructor]|uniref:Uncharacterized protein n=1 Tax=Ditylenchus destructor TaxID=166010 RepID=A0AAD4R383_9BILA|nr:hypothetical protein DdX_12973 [Ditylenchus destructor]